jgi:hypothetical protein
LGIIYLVVGILGFVVPMMFGLIPHGYTIFDDLLHLVLGGSASLWPSLRREELRRAGARPTPSATTLVTLGGDG